MNISFHISLCPLTAGKAKRRGTVCKEGKKPEKDECGDLFSAAAFCAQNDVPKYCIFEGELGQPAWVRYYKK